MSSLIVPVATVDRVREHGNADALEIAEVLGWQVVVRKGEFSEGDKVVYFPPDTMLLPEVSDRFGVTKYLSNGRLRCARLRGEPSFGLIVRPDDEAWPVGDNAAGHYGAVKYEPPVRPQAGDAAPEHPLFPAYTDIENLRHYPDIFAEGERVVVVEKLHGTNCRVGIVEGEVMAGSRKTRRKKPDGEAAQRQHLYWFPYTLNSVLALLDALSRKHRQVVLYGEVYGKVQHLTYGLPGKLAFRAFDLLVDGRYLDWTALLETCLGYGVELAPPIAVGVPYSLDLVKGYSEGQSTVPGAAHIREGVVVRPLRERTDPRIGRVILKYVSDEYLLGNHTDEPEQ